MRRTTVKIPDELDHRLRREAERRGITVSMLVREALESHLGRDEPRRFLSKGVISGDGTSSAEKLDEILAEIYEERHRQRWEDQEQRSDR